MKHEDALSLAKHSVTSKPVEGTMTASLSLPYYQYKGAFPVEYTLSDHPGQNSSTIPYGKLERPSYYNTAYDWGDPEFLEWWRLNYKGNEGKILSYKGIPIRMITGTRMRATNLAGNVAPGVYPSGTVTDKRMLNQPNIEYTSSILPGYKQVGVTDILFVDPGTLKLGETVTLGKGGAINYINYIN